MMDTQTAAFHQRTWRGRRRPSGTLLSRNTLSLIRFAYHLALVLLFNNGNALVAAFYNHRYVLRNSATICDATRSQVPLEECTVKELRELVKKVATERGTLSKLKRKQDLVKFLQEHDTSCVRKAVPFHMAPLTATSALMTPQGQEDASTLAANTDIASPTPTSSPKDAIFERVYQRYPVLRHLESTFQSANLMDSLTDDLDGKEDMTATNNIDIRQWQHPIYTHYNKTSSDMDVIFVGTASCAPSVTRGVSCTALRLLNGGGGTWLFDVGECTQVCSYFFGTVTYYHPLCGLIFTLNT
jgi:hypothetical protein